VGNWTEAIACPGLEVNGVVSGAYAGGNNIDIIGSNSPDDVAAVVDGIAEGQWSKTVTADVMRTHPGRRRHVGAVDGAGDCNVLS
jgi:hypothetical protein